MGRADELTKAGMLDPETTLVQNLDWYLGNRSTGLTVSELDALLEARNAVRRRQSREALASKAPS